jgi:hypothetical protein
MLENHEIPFPCPPTVIIEQVVAVHLLSVAALGPEAPGKRLGQRSRGL